MKTVPPSMLFKNRTTGIVETISFRATRQRQVLSTLGKSGRLSTGKLTAEIGCARSSCYGACRTLKKKHLVTSEKRVAGKVFWDPVTCTFMGRSNHDWMVRERGRAHRRMLKEVKARIPKQEKKSLKRIDSKLAQFLDPDMMPAARADGIPGEVLRRRFALISFDDCPHRWWLAVHLLECLALMVLLLEKSGVISDSDRDAWLRRKIREILAFVPVSFSEVDWQLGEEWELLKAA